MLAEHGLDPNLVSLCVSPSRAATQALARDPAVRSVDFTGGNAFGQWLLQHCPQAQVYAELAGSTTSSSTPPTNTKPCWAIWPLPCRCIPGRCAPPARPSSVPAGGIDTDEGHKSFDEVCADLARAVQRLLGKPEVAHAVLGAIQSADTLARIDQANRGELGQVLLAASALDNPEFPAAQVRTPALLACDAADEALYMEERFGPISFVVKTADTAASLALCERLVSQHGALTVGVYSTREDIIDAATAVTWRGKGGAVDQPHGRRVRQPVGGVLRLPRHGRQPGGQRRLRQFGLCRQPLLRCATPSPCLRNRPWAFNTFCLRARRRGAADAEPPGRAQQPDRRHAHRAARRAGSGAGRPGHSRAGAQRRRARLLRRAGFADPGMQAVDGKLPDLGDIVERNYKPLVLRLQNLRVPTVAAVNGVAAGAGASLALACDLVVAANPRRFCKHSARSA